MSGQGSNLDERARHRRLAWAAGLTLFSLLAGHTVLEVARDALFLATLPASELPFTYLAIALAAWAAVQVDRRLSTRLEQRRLAMGTLLVAALGTVGFYFAFGSDEWWVWFVPHLFYIWAGLVSTFAVTQFWRLLAELFTVGEARRLYSRIAAGGSLGAIAGASLASVAQAWLGPRELLLAGAGMLAVTAAIPALLFEPVPPVDSRSTSTDKSAASPEESAYVRRLLALVALTAVTTIIVDYVFKASIAEELRPEELAPFFSTFYVALNVVSLAVQITLAPRLLTWLGAPRALAVLPMLFAIGAICHAATGIFALAVLLKGSDGALRHSLHRSAAELLYLPLSKAVRNRYKTLIDALGQRGGQALGSISILIVGLFGMGPRHLGPVIAGLSVAWVALAISLHRRYLDRFRANLRVGSIETRVEIPQLDLGSLESLIASLNSARDEEVLATLDVLVDYQREALVPTLLLYHPSEAVVLRTLHVLGMSSRVDYVPVARRLLEHPDEEVQAAAMHAIADHLSEDELAAELEHGHARSVRAAILVALVTHHPGPGSAEAELEECSGSDDLAVKLALARAIRFSANPALVPFLRQMGAGAPPELARELARAYGAIASTETVADLIPLLGPRVARLEARDALAGIGEPALDTLIAMLADETTELELRAHIPRTLARFVTERSARALLAQLVVERDGWIFYKLLRALRPLREAMPSLRVDAAELTRLMRQDLVRSAEVLAWSADLETALAEDRARVTRGTTLLRPALREKEHQALDRVVRLIALLRPNEDLRRITNALRHDDRRRRAESRELLMALAPASIAAALDAMLDDAPDEERVARVFDALSRTREPLGYEALLAALLGDRSESVRTVTAYHVGERRIEALRPALTRAAGLVVGLSHDVVTRALDELDTAARSGATRSGAVQPRSSVDE